MRQHATLLGNNYYRYVSTAANLNSNVQIIRYMDGTAPTLTISVPNASTYTRTKSVTITAADSESGLAPGNFYEYALSSSSSTAPTTGWNTYTNGTAFTLGNQTICIDGTVYETLTGTYYLWVRHVYDKVGHSSARSR